MADPTPPASTPDKGNMRGGAPMVRLNHNHPVLKFCTWVGILVLFLIFVFVVGPFLMAGHKTKDVPTPAPVIVVQQPASTVPAAPEVANPTPPAPTECTMASTTDQWCSFTGKVFVRTAPGGTLCHIGTFTRVEKAYEGGTYVGNNFICADGMSCRVVYHQPTQGETCSG